MEKKKWSTQKMIYTAMLAALAGALMLGKRRIPAEEIAQIVDMDEVIVRKWINKE